MLEKHLLEIIYSFFLNYDLNVSIWFLNEDECNATKKIEISNI